MNSRQRALVISICCVAFAIVSVQVAQVQPEPRKPASTNTIHRIRRNFGDASPSSRLPDLPQMRASVTRVTDEVRFAKTHGLAQWEYLDAYLYWLRQRAYPNDRIELTTLKAGLQHKFGMSLEGTTGSNGHRWEFVGPRNLPTPYRQYFGIGVTSGRVNGVAFDPLDSNIVYAATAGGGVWRIDRSTNTSVSLSDGWIDTKTSCIAVSASGAQRTLYVGTGDFDGGRSIYGFGIMKSSDGGMTWINLLNQELSGYSVKHILIHPDNPQVVLVTAGNSLDALGAIWRSSDAGATWAKANVDSADWQDVTCAVQGLTAKRYCYAVGAGIRGQVWRSDDTGQTWTKLAPSISWNYQRSFAIAASQHDPLAVYLLAGTDRTIWASRDAGMTWTDTTRDFPPGDANYNWGQSDYDFFIACTTHPVTHADVLYAGLIDIIASTDGGVHWASIGNTYQDTAVTHNDQHAFAVNPKNSAEALLGNDGGIYLVTLDVASDTWKIDSALNANLGITQFL